MINFKNFTMRRSLIVSAVIVVILVAVGVGLFTARKNDRADDAILQTVSRVCSGDIVKQYNTIARDTDVPVPNYAPVYDMVRTKPHWSGDANCVYIALQHAIYSQNGNESRQMLEQLNALDDRGLSVSNTLVGVQSRTALQQIVDYVAAAKSTGTPTERGL